MPNFQWQPTVDTRLAGSIGDIMARSGDVRAESIRAAGAAKAHAIGTIGQAAAGTLEDIMQGRRVEKQKQTAKAEQEAIAQVLHRAAKPDGSYDLEQIRSTLPPALGSHLQPLLEFADKANTSRLSQLKTTAELAPKPVEPPKTREVQVRQPDGSIVIKIVEDKPGTEFTSAPEVKPTPTVTYGPPQVQMVKGKRALVRAGSDGKLYDANTRQEVMATPEPEKATGAASGLPAWASAPAEPPVPGGGRNDAALTKLPPEIAAQVKAIVEGRRSLDPRVVSTPAGKALLDAAYAYDPSFDQVNYNSRAKTRADFTSGASAKQINALNTVVGHLASLSDAAEALGNGNVQYFNTAKNWLKTQLGAEEVPKFETVKKAVSDELTRVWRQSGGAEADIKAWQESLNASGSPAQLGGVITQIGDLLESKLTSLQDQFRQGMGTNDISVITPEASKTLARLRGQDAPAAAGPQAGPAAGDRRLISGQLAEWDGKGWKAVGH